MKIIKPRKFESIDGCAIIYLIVTIIMATETNIHKPNPIINLLLLLIYFKIRFIE